MSTQKIEWHLDHLTELIRLLNPPSSKTIVEPSLHKFNAQLSGKRKLDTSIYSLLKRINH